ncbi:MAG: GNAT family N-acetyltransferase [Candidatus Hermodarchaeota archaeon]
MIRVEDVILDDLDEIYNLERITFNEDAFSKQILRSLISHNTLFLKAINEKNKIIGFVIALQESVHIINIINFLIDKDYQNKGFGGILLDLTLNKIKQIPLIKKIILNVNTKNTTAQKLYAKFNFRITQKVENYYHNNENAYLMELDL